VTRLSVTVVWAVLCVYARLLVQALGMQLKNFKEDPKEYCRTLVRENWRVFGVAMFMNVLGIALLILFVTYAGVPKRWGDPLVGAVLYPIGWALNKYFAFRKQREGFKWYHALSAFAWPPMIWAAHKSLWRKLKGGLLWKACKSRWDKTTDGVLDDTERWMIKTFAFMMVGKCSYQLLVSLGFNYIYVRIFLMCTVGPLSILANYWVFRRSDEKAEEAVPLDAVIETT
jgi:hypothetical protein